MITASSYTDTQFEQIVSRVQRVDPDRTIDTQALLHSLLTFLTATGVIADGDFADAFQELAEVKPSPKILTDLYDRLQSTSVIRASKQVRHQADGIATLLTSQIRTQLRRQGLNPDGVSVRYNAQLRSWAATRADIPQADWVKACAKLAAHHRQSVIRGPQSNSALDSVLLGLARIFVEAIDAKSDGTDLPHGDRSHFILFAHDCLAPFIQHTQIEPAALAQRWKRLKRAT